MKNFFGVSAGVLAAACLRLEVQWPIQKLV